MRADADAATAKDGRSVEGLASILAFTDLSAPATLAVRRAASLARQHGAALSVVHVVEPPAFTTRDAWLDTSEGRSRVASAEADLASHVQALGPLGGAVRAQVVVGAVDDEILGLADQASLLVLGARGSGSVKSLLLGSTATRLLTKCSRPMLVVKQDAVGAYSRVLIPIDLQDDASKTLQAAQALAPDAQLHVLHAYHAENEGMMRRAGLSRESLQTARRVAKAKAQARLLAVLAGAENGSRPFLHRLKRDHPVRLILDSERRFGPDLIMMSKRSRSRLEDALLGSTTKRVLLDSRCDVLVVPLVAVEGV